MCAFERSEKGMDFIMEKERISHLDSTACLEWINIDDLNKIRQFDQNQKFTPYLFKNELFEGKFLLDDSCKVLKYKIRKM